MLSGPYAHSLVMNNPEFVVSMFNNPVQIDDVPETDIPVEERATAKLLPAEGAATCGESDSSSAAILRASSQDPVDMQVTLHGAFPPIILTYMSGDKLRRSDNSEQSAWIALFQAAMLFYAKEDGDMTGQPTTEGPEPNYREKGPWSTVKGVESIDGSKDYERQFDSDAKVQDCKRLDRMLFLATGKPTSHKGVQYVGDVELRNILGAMSGSPVLVIPKEIEGNYLPSDRIWIGKKTAAQGAWTFYNPVERKYRDATIQQLRDSVQDIIYFDDHSPL